MSTILTDDERRQLIQSIVLISPGTHEQISRAVESAVLAKLREQEPVAVVGDVWTLNWVGYGPIAPIIEKHNIKIGDFLYTHPAPQQADRQRVPDGWIETSKAMPPSGQVVLACYKNELGNTRRIRAQWVAEKTSEASVDSDCGEYDEATDTYYDPEGWYECIDNWDCYSSVFVSAQITHWMPLPPAPDAAAAAPEAPAQAEQTKCVPCPYCGANTASTNPANWCACPKTPAQASAQCDGAKSLLMEISGDLQIMMGSAVELHDSKGDVAGYQVMTGALHRIFGHLSAAGVPVSIPSRMKKSVLVKGSTKASPELLASVSNILALADSPQGHRGMDGETHYKAPAQASAVDERAAAEVTEFNVGRWCLSEDDCIEQGIDFAAYERGVADAAAAFGRNRARVANGIGGEGKR